MTDASIEALYRYPVKGLSPEALSDVTLRAGEYVPGDRLFAVENGPSGFDPAAPRHQTKIKFLMLMRNARLAALHTRFDDATGVLTITPPAGAPLRADLRSPEGRAAVAAFFRDTMPEELRGPPQVLTAPPGFRFTDSRRGFVSLINLASVAALEQEIGAPVDPLRFRANLLVAGWPAWHEFDLVGRELRIGTARLKITSRIVRCAATEVDPVTARRDLPVPATLMRRFGHADCGVYAEVREGGRIAPGDVVRLAAGEQAALPL